jgi:hypothetical protein
MTWLNAIAATISDTRQHINMQAPNAPISAMSGVSRGMIAGDVGWFRSPDAIADGGTTAAPIDNAPSAA